MFIYTCPRLYDQKLKGGIFMYFTFPLSKKDKYIIVVIVKIKEFACFYTKCLLSTDNPHPIFKKK